MSKNLIATENMLDVEKTVVEMFDAVRENVAKNVNTVDAANALIGKLSEEAASFNDCLTYMSNAIHKCEAGECSREEMLAVCAPCVKALKEKCSAIQLGGIKTTDGDITETEIALLREYIVGCKDIVVERKTALQDSCCAEEGLLSSLSGMTSAMEASKEVIQIRKSTEAKTAAQLYKQAKSLYGYGSKDKAIEYLKKAQKLYETCLTKAEKASKMIDSKRTITSGNSTLGNYSLSDTFDKKVTESTSGAFIMTYFEDRIDSCKALMLQWTNKAGNKSFKETKDQLKAERKAAHRAKRLADAKERAGKKAANKMKVAANKYKAPEEAAAESLLEDAEVLESLADSLDLEYAMEAEGDESEASAISPEEVKMRELVAEMKKAKADGDEEAYTKALNEFNKVYEQVKKQAADAYTDEDLKAADRKLAKCLAIGAAVAAGAAAIGIVGTKTGAFKKLGDTVTAQVNKLKEKKGADKTETKKSFNLAATLGSALKSLPSKVKGAFKKKAPASRGETLPGDWSVDSMINADEIISACESLMDGVELELAMEAALEADGDEGEGEESPKSPSTLGAKIRAAFAKLKKAKTSDDAAAVKEATDEIEEVTKEVSDAYNEAETPEEKKRLSKTAKIALAAAGAAAATFAATAAIGSKALKTAGGSFDNVPAAMKLAANAAIAVARAKNSISKVFKKKGAQARLPKASTESVLSFMATGLEALLEESEDEDEIEPEEGREFDGDEMMEDAAESELEDVSMEATLALMAAEDGIIEE